MLLKPVQKHGQNLPGLGGTIKISIIKYRGEWCKMKNILCSICLFFLVTLSVFSQDVMEITGKEIHNSIIQYFENERLIEQAKIMTYDDLVCTFWAKEMDINYVGQEYINHGYIFLPNNLFLWVITKCIPIIYNENNIYSGQVVIYSIECLGTYEIIEDILFFRLGNPNNELIYAYLENSYLYISFNNEDPEKYRLEKNINIVVSEN